jgi:hypothetical protein
MINDPGEMNEQVTILGLQKVDSAYSWADQAQIWAKAEAEATKNLFSEVGNGAKSVKFTVWKQGFTLHNAFRWRGNFCFLTDITEIDHVYYEVTAAMIEPKTCVKLQGDGLQDDFHRPDESEPKPVLTFPGCLVEKYQGFQKLNPQSQVAVTFVLVTPKEIALASGDLLSIDDLTYGVQIVHDLDAYKNEYEIGRVGEA